LSVDTKSDSELLELLELSSNLLNKIELTNSATILDGIRTYISAETPNTLDRNHISEEFKNLQASCQSEFSTTTHKGNCIALLLTAFRRSLTDHHQESVEVINNNLRIDKQEKRVRSYRNLQLLKKIVLQGASDDEERLIGISYAYLSLVDGIYTTSLLECYVWDRISRNLPVNIESVYRMSIANVYDYFKNQSLPLYYFDGWDVKVRNAVAHSSFKFDKDTNKMIYEATTGISEYDFNEMVENYEKLESIYPMILSAVQITAINDVLDEFVRRYP